MNLFNNIFKKKEKRGNEYSYITSYADALTFGCIMPSSNAMAISSVYRAVDIISDAIASLPIQVKLKDRKHKDVVENHPIYTAFYGGLLSKYQIMKLMVQSVLLYGNGYAYTKRAADGTVTGIKYLRPQSMNIHYDVVRDELYYISYDLNNNANAIEPCNIIHLAKNSFDGITGESVIKYADRTIRNANSTEESANDFFTNGRNLSGVLKVQGQVSDKQKQEIRSSWNQAYSKGGNGLAVLQGNMDYQPIQLSAADSQMIESRQYNVQDIARFFGISPVLLGDLSHSSYSTLEAVQNQFLLQTLQPYITMIEDEFNRKLLLPSESNLTINLDETYLMRSDKTATATYYSTLIDKGILCVNEARRELGYSEIEGGDKHIIPYTSINSNIINKEQTTDGNEEK